jgi:hypothetical protein
MSNERQRTIIENHNKIMQDMFNQNRENRNNRGHRVSLADFQNTRPTPFASVPKPMDAEDWLLDIDRKFKIVGYNDDEKIRYATHLLCGPAAV